MKFRGFVLFVLFIFIGIFSVNAATIDYHEGLKCEPYIVEDDGRVSMTCQIGFQVKDGVALYNSIRGSLTLNNVEFGSITPSGDWHIESKGDKNFYLSTSKTKLDEGYHVVATAKFYKIAKEKECSVVYEFSFSNEERKCISYHGTYYGKDGNVTDKKTYELECLKHVCEIVDGHYFNKDGVEVSHLDYQKNCELNICKILSDGTHYGKDGKVVTESQYITECEKPVCEIRDGKYYNKESKEVTKLEYQKECEKNVCKVLSDGTHYGKDGKVVSESQYVTECEKPVCEIRDGKYYDNESREVTKLEYQKVCEVNICKMLSDGTYYGKDGKVVTESVYKSECEKAPICEVRDGKFYGKDGKEVDEKTYRTTCEVHKCQIINNMYFDNKGRVVSEGEFNKACNAPVDNPQTGATISYAFVTSLILGLFGGLKYLKRQNKIYHL